MHPETRTFFLCCEEERKALMAVVMALVTSIMTVVFAAIIFLGVFCLIRLIQNRAEIISEAGSELFGLWIGVSVMMALIPAGIIALIVRAMISALL